MESIQGMKLSQTIRRMCVVQQRQFVLRSPPVRMIVKFYILYTLIVCLMG